MEQPTIDRKTLQYKWVVGIGYPRIERVHV
jgi:hypothetical protein